MGGAKKNHFPDQTFAFCVQGHHEEQCKEEIALF